MKKVKLNIGKIPYANLFPTFYYFENECNLNGYSFITGVPSKLNKMLREGKLDISPSSSIEYLRNKSIYRILPCFSISSSGPIGSILLFSKLPLRKLQGRTIAVSSDSETSAALLKIIFNEFLSLQCRYRPLVHSRCKNHASFSATLLIGDEAMKEAKKQSFIKNREATSGKGKVKELPSDLRVLGTESFPYLYDLGELWFNHTGLPFPFIAKQAVQKKWLSTKELIDYWERISYDFSDKHLEGLSLFEKLAMKYNLLA
jgi:chorismate dehydratase